MDRNQNVDFRYIYDVLESFHSVRVASSVKNDVVFLFNDFCQRAIFGDIQLNKMNERARLC